jgi:hypothetical protein
MEENSGFTGPTGPTGPTEPTEPTGFAELAKQAKFNFTRLSEPTAIAGRKRQRRTSSASQEPTVQATIQGLQASRHSTAVEMMKTALQLAEKAALLSPTKAYTTAVQALQAAIQPITLVTSQPTVEQQIQWLYRHFQEPTQLKQQPKLQEPKLQHTQRPDKPSYSSAVKKNLQPLQNKATATEKATKQPIQKANSKPSQAKKQPTTKPIEHSQVILVTNKAMPLPAIDTVAIRNQINEAIGKKAIVKVEKSTRNNIVLTTKHTVYSNTQLLENQ